MLSKKHFQLVLCLYNSIWIQRYLRFITIGLIQWGSLVNLENDYLDFEMFKWDYFNSQPGEKLVQ